MKWVYGSSSSNLLYPKIHLPVYMLWLIILTIKKIQIMLVTEETGYGSYGNSLYYFLNFSVI